MDFSLLLDNEPAYNGDKVLLYFLYYNVKDYQKNIILLKFTELYNLKKHFSVFFLNVF